MYRRVSRDGCFDQGRVARRESVKKREQRRRVREFQRGVTAGEVQRRRGKEKKKKLDFLGGS